MLDNIRIAQPCKADWDSMKGNDRVRHCAECNLNVYNLSEMTKDEAEQLVLHTEGRLCVRFFRRRDGRVLTSDCPVGVRALRYRFLLLGGGPAIAAGLLLIYFQSFESAQGKMECPIQRASPVTENQAEESPPNEYQLAEAPPVNTHYRLEEAVIANRTINSGELISADMLRREMREGAVSHSGGADFKSAVGHKARVTISHGMIIARQDLADCEK